MALFKFSTKKKTPLSASPATPTPPAPPVRRPKTLADLEKEIDQASVMRPQPMQRQPSQRQSLGLRTTLVLGTIFLGIPAAAIWAVNLPYPIVRRPVARHAPLLLLPSYVRFDQDFREAIALAEQAKQLIDNATSPADIELGAQRVTEAQAKLDALPLDLMDYWAAGSYPRYGYGYGTWRFSPLAFNQTRAEIGALEAKVFQEQNANTTLTNAEQALSNAKLAFETAQDDVSRQGAIAQWQAALGQLAAVPEETLAGRLAENRLSVAQTEFQSTVGLLAENRTAAGIISAARALGLQAAQLSQNPPHPVTHWREVERLWASAIQELEQISPSDLGYTDAQSIAAEYQANLSAIRIRMGAEEEANRIYAAATRDIDALVQDNYLSTDEAIHRLQSIIQSLQAIPNGTTVYADAAYLIERAQNRITELQP